MIIFSFFLRQLKKITTYILHFFFKTDKLSYSSKISLPLAPSKGGSKKHFPLWRGIQGEENSNSVANSYKLKAGYGIWRTKKQTPFLLLFFTLHSVFLPFQTDAQNAGCETELYKIVEDLKQYKQEYCTLMGMKGCTIPPINKSVSCEDNINSYNTLITYYKGEIEQATGTSPSPQSAKPRVSLTPTVSKEQVTENTLPIYKPQTSQPTPVTPTPAPTPQLSEADLLKAEIAALKRENNDLRIQSANADRPLSNDQKNFIRSLIAQSADQSFGMVYQHYAINNTFDAYIVNLATDKVELFWQNTKGKRYGSLKGLETHLKTFRKTLAFATNGGMFSPRMSPVGLYIENGQILQRIELNQGKGNFYMMPNGVFSIDKSGLPSIVETQTYARLRLQDNALFATQSGPMLVINNEIHPQFTKGSVNKKIRSGVGVIDNQHLVFIISRQPVNFYDFATIFRDYYACDNALYLDGAISKMYVPQQREEKGGDFGVIIGVVK